jgi:hypothetical protein
MPEPRELLRFAVVGLAAYGVTLLGDYSLKLTVFREKPVTALFFATASLTAPRLVWSPPTSQPEPRQTKGRRNGSTAIASASASAGLSRTASAR